MRFMVSLFFRVFFFLLLLLTIIQKEIERKKYKRESDFVISLINHQNSFQKIVNGDQSTGRYINLIINSYFQYPVSVYNRQFNEEYIEKYS